MELNRSILRGFSFKFSELNCPSFIETIVGINYDNYGELLEKFKRFKRQYGTFFISIDYLITSPR